MLSILHASGVDSITDIKQIFRYTYKPKYDPMTQNLFIIPPYSDTHTLFSATENIKIDDIDTDDIDTVNDTYNFNWDKQDLDYYKSLFKHRDATITELYDIAQSNSEHSRHRFFNSKIFINNIPLENTLFQLIKKSLLNNPSTIVSFKDNSSAIKGSHNTSLINHSGFLHPHNHKHNITLTAETHNFPTGIAPYQGAMTGVGGRQRDNQSIGRGGLLRFGITGYCVGDLDNSLLPLSMSTPLEILLKASDGVSDYGNHTGEPLLQGFTRTHRTWLKPILYSAGVGQVLQKDTIKPIPYPGLLVVKIGGPAYRIGIGGGNASSRSNVTEKDKNAVQRGDALMNHILDQVIQTCVLQKHNPIFSISDQGAGGNSNVIKELVHPWGAEINLDHLISGDSTMTATELWVAEYQESQALLVKPENIKLLTTICERESCPICIIGKVTKSNRIVVYHKGDKVVDLDRTQVLDNIPQKVYHFQKYSSSIPPQITPSLQFNFSRVFTQILKLPSVCSKQFLTTKVDRTVKGLTVQQQTVGPLQLPLSDVAISAQSYNSNKGIATGIGERPLLSNIDVKRMVSIAVAESLTNLMWTPVSHIGCSANWMWPDKNIELVTACQELSRFICNLGIMAIDGGKDSLSMKTLSKDKKIVKAPGSLVITSYAECTDIMKVVTPVLIPNKPIYFVEPKRPGILGGSALHQCFEETEFGNCPYVTENEIRDLFRFIQTLVKNEEIISGHDRSDGGLITCLAEMAFAGNCGLRVDINSYSNSIFTYFFHEGIGVAFQLLNECDPYLILPETLSLVKIGYSTEELTLRINIQGKEYYREDIRTLRDNWSSTSFNLDKLQSNPITVEQERKSLLDRKGPNYSITFPIILPRIFTKNKPIVSVIRTLGTNGHKELQHVFYEVGFDVIDLNMSDLLKKPSLLQGCRGIAFPGGFSYGDVMGGGKGWGTIWKSHDKLNAELLEFFGRDDTFSVGICNGFQLMCELNIFSGKLRENISRRFESRYISVKIKKSNSIFFRDMEGSVIPVWCAHSTGRYCSTHNEKIVMEYADDTGKSTKNYPYSPNGGKIAGVCSENGRHLGLMPHPERTFKNWQLAWNPEQWIISPWMKMFYNVYQWCQFQ